MKVFIAATFVGLSVYIYQGGNLPIPKTVLNRSFKLKRISKSHNDQEFLEYLWLLKSELSTGINTANIQLITPSHRLSSRINLIFKISSETGAAITPSINRFITQAKNQIELKQEIEAELASTKATVFVLAGLPFFGLLLGNLLNGNSINWLLSTSMGRICMSLALLLNITGIFWIKKIIQKSLVA